MFIGNDKQVRLNEALHARVLPVVSKWANASLVPTSVYGIRVYQNGSMLRSQTGQVNTHVISAIVHVGHTLHEPWPLEIEDHHTGRIHTVILEPGEMLLYESSALFHSRLTPMNGSDYGSVILHYAPVGWNWTTLDCQNAIHPAVSFVPAQSTQTPECCGEHPRACCKVLMRDLPPIELYRRQYYARRKQALPEFVGDTGTNGGVFNRANTVSVLRHEAHDIIELSMDNPQTLHLLKQRGENHPPIVVRGAAQAFNWTSSKTTRDILQAMGRKLGDNASPYKISNNRRFSYWDFNMPWSPEFELVNAAPVGFSAPFHKRAFEQRRWHQWGAANFQAQAFQELYDAPGPPFVYWLQAIQNVATTDITDIIGFEPRNVLCSTFTMPEEHESCKRTVGVLWASSKGVFTQAHYDQMSNIQLQLEGVKKWTFWPPSAIGKLCIHPYTHPAARQSQSGLDMGTDTEKICGPLPQNRSVVLYPGDLLLVGKYWTHAVEAMTATSSFSVGPMSREMKAHQDVASNIVLWWIATQRVLRKQLPSLQMSQVSAVLRFSLRSVLAALRPSILTEQQICETESGGWCRVVSELWQEFERLPDVTVLGGGALDTRKLCQDEQNLPPALLDYLVDSTFSIVATWEDVRSDLVEDQLFHAVSGFLTIAQARYRKDIAYDKSAVENILGPYMALNETRGWIDALQHCRLRSRT
jgi:hypothetical protein